MKIKDLAKYKTLDITQLSGSPWNTAEKVLGLDSGDTVVMANRMDDEAKQYTDDAIASALTSYYTKDEVDEIVEDIDVTEQLTNYYTKGEVDTANAAQDERIENNENDIADLQSEMVNKSELETAMADETARTENTYAKPSDIPSLDGYAKTSAVTQDIQAAIASETARTENVYAKKSEIPDLDNYYTKSETDEAIEEAISGISLEGYWTSAQTKNYVDAEITGATASETARTESTYAKKSEIPSLDGYATEQYVDDAIAAIPQVDLSAYAKTTAVTQDIQTAIAAETGRTEDVYAKKSEIPSLNGYATEDYVDSSVAAATATTTGWVESQGYLTQHQDISGKLDVSTFNTYTGATETVLEGKADISDIPDVSDFVTSGEVTTQIDTAIAAETARTESTYLKEHQDISGKVDKTDFNTYTGATATAIAAKQDTLVSGTNIKTINNQSLLGSGNIDIQGGGGGGSVVELTKAEYEALDPPAADTTYIITDADVVDLNDYAKASGLSELSGTVETLSSTKADKQSVTARASNSNYLPGWNAQGVITGSTAYYNKNQRINGSDYSVFSNSNTNHPAIYAPTSAGTAGQPLLSNGSGAPVWGQYSFQFISQSAYDALTTKSSTTIYFVVDPS